MMSPHGRIGRMDFLVLSTLVLGGALLGTTAVGLVAAMYDNNESVMMAGSLLVVGLSAFVLLCLTIRRLHDLGRSGVAVLFGLIPGVNIAFSLYVLFWRGDAGPNAYGPRPSRIVERSRFLRRRRTVRVVVTR